MLASYLTLLSFIEREPIRQVVNRSTTTKHKTLHNVTVLFYPFFPTLLNIYIYIYIVGVKGRVTQIYVYVGPIAQSEDSR